MSMQSLFHISDKPDIEVFEPRMPPTENSMIQSPVVWAVNQECLPHYLVPRECPRVAFRLSPSSSEQDREKFFRLGGTRHIVAIESRWFERAVSSILWSYEFSPEPFVCADATAGYFVSSVAVTPASCRCIERPLAELVASGVELRIVPSLLVLASAVASSSLAFSCIRMRNADRGPGL
jgi:hypothetical protein